MEKIQEIIIRKNFKNVATIMNKYGDIEELTDEGQPNINEVIQGVADLNKNGIVVLDIQSGTSREGVTKIKNIESFGLFLEGEWIKEPFTDVSIPEVNIIPFKSDSWILGEYIVKQRTGKYIPKRFLKSQNLLDKFSGDDEILRKLLVLDPEKRSYTWELFNELNNGCLIQ